MENIGLNDIRKSFLEFFKSKEHLVLPSFSLIPESDKTLLLINAGMAPLKPYFTGQMKPPKKRLATCQKCIRTPDIERVGKTARHGTFFEMLGNFSFGDYFKEDAIKWAWEYITQVIKLPIDKLWISIYEDDDEAFEIWNTQVGIPKEKIVRLGKDDNFWELGVGPCGPSSEIYFDRGEKYGCKSPTCKVGCDCDRFVEFWNLVFTQFDKDKEGNYNKLDKPSIDTGMGLERIAVIMQDVASIFEVDTIRSVVNRICDIAKVKYDENKENDVSVRVITDHIRSATFMISDGVIPSNEGRGYVLRRIIRRASRHGRLLGIKDLFLNQLVDTVIEESSDAYPVLNDKKNYIKNVVLIEEQRFQQTIDQGIIILEQYIEELKKDDGILSGDKAFKLYDTYGFPLDLTKEILTEQGYSVDEDSFDENMEKQRQMARAAREDSNYIDPDEKIFSYMKELGITEFKGYDNAIVKAKVLAIINSGEMIERAQNGDQVSVILDSTTFYPEGGGQVSDTGMLVSGNGSILIEKSIKAYGNIIIHNGVVTQGQILTGDYLETRIDTKKREATARNHSATHLLHKALQEVVGTHVKQAGSFVTQDRLRFDFSHFEELTPSEVQQLEQKVNEAILNNMEVNISCMSIDDAKKDGAVALFDDKYGQEVRVVKMGEYSTELCGGTHVRATGQIGLFKILSENGIAAGVRRIEAITGMDILKYLYDKQKLISETSQRLKTEEALVLNRIDSLLSEMKEKDREIKSMKSKMVSGSVDSFLSMVKIVGGIEVIAERVDNMDAEAMRNLGDSLKEKLDTGFILLVSGENQKVTFVAMATKKAVGKGIHVGNIIGEAARITGGGGGGRPDIAQAGGKHIEKIDQAISFVLDKILKETEKELL